VSRPSVSELTALLVEHYKREGYGHFCSERNMLARAQEILRHDVLPRWLQFALAERRKQQAEQQSAKKGRQP
jgi:hypothetical protein